MNYKTAICAVALIFVGGCDASVTPAPKIQTEADITTCMRTVLEMDEGRWDYMGTIARLDGKFRTYQATSVHMAMGDDVWASKSFGGDVGGTEEEAEFGQVKLVGTLMIPIEDGELKYDGAIQYISCTGPDIEGRYEVELDYKLPNGDGTFDTAKK